LLVLVLAACGSSTPAGSPAPAPTDDAGVDAPALACDVFPATSFPLDAVGPDPWHHRVALCAAGNERRRAPAFSTRRALLSCSLARERWRRSLSANGAVVAETDLGISDASPYPLRLVGIADDVYFLAYQRGTGTALRAMGRFFDYRAR
jgi:hypothetical protein